MQENYDNNIKSSLDYIKVPDNISSYISKGVRKRRYLNRAGMICKCLVALMIVTVTLGNLSPTLAKEIEKVPGVGSVFKYLHWNKSLAVLEKMGLIKNVNIKYENEDVEFIVNSFVSDDKGVVIYYETRSKEDYFVISKYNLSGGNDNFITGVNGVQDIGIKKSLKNGVYYVKGYIRENDLTAFDSVEKLNLSANLIPLQKKDEEIAALKPKDYKGMSTEEVKNAIDEERKVRYSWNVEFSIEPIPFETSTIEFNKKIYEDDKFKITLLELGVAPLNSEFRLHVNNFMDETQCDSEKMVSIDFGLSDGKSKYRTWLMNTSSIAHEKAESEVNYTVTTESDYFSESKELYIEDIFITYYERLEEPLLINLSKRTVCDGYKNNIRFVDFEKLENGGCIVTLTQEEGISYSEEGGREFLVYSEPDKDNEKNTRLYFNDVKDVEKITLKVLSEVKIENKDIHLKIK